MCSRVSSSAAPEWSRWRPPPAPYTVGVEEEVILVDGGDWSPCHRSDAVLARLSPALRAHLGTETHGSAIELRTTVHRTVGEAVDQVRGVRAALADELEPLGIRPLCAGIHPVQAAGESTVSGGERYRGLASSLRALAIREPTYALHVHVGIPAADEALRVMNRMSAHLPLLLALSANSPFWRGEDSGLASMRTPVFQAFPRTGLPRRFGSYEEYVAAIDQLIQLRAIPGPSYLWWDVRLQPGLGTLEVRIMDAQIAAEDTASLAALVQCLVRAELEGELAPAALLDAPELLAENRFLAARDGVEAALIDPETGGPASVRRLLERTLSACEPHAHALGCASELAGAMRLAKRPGATRQRELARGPGGLAAMLAELAAAFAADNGAPALT